MFATIKTKLGRSTIYVEFVLIVLMFLLSFITFKNIFSQTKNGDYFQEVIAALIGTLLTIIITFILLKQQTKTEELKEQNVEVFRKRVVYYEEMIQLLVDVREDGEVDANDAKLLTKAIYKLALLSNENTISTVSQFVENIVFEDGEQSEVGLLDVIACFRSEIKLEGIDEFSMNLGAVEKLLANGFDKTDFSKIEQLISDAEEKIISVFENSTTPNIFSSYEFSTVIRDGKSSNFVITSTNSKLDYQVVIENEDPTTEKLHFRVVGSAEIDEEGRRKPLAKAKMQRITLQATPRGFEISNEDEDGFWGFFKYYSLESDKPSSDVLDRAAQQIAQDILEIEKFNLDSRR